MWEGWGKKKHDGKRMPCGGRRLLWGEGKALHSGRSI